MGAVCMVEEPGGSQCGVGGCESLQGDWHRQVAVVCVLWGQGVSLIGAMGGDDEGHAGRDREMCMEVGAPACLLIWCMLGQIVCSSLGKALVIARAELRQMIIPRMHFVDGCSRVLPVLCRGSTSTLGC